MSFSYSDPINGWYGFTTWDYTGSKPWRLYDPSIFVNIKTNTLQLRFTDSVDLKVSHVYTYNLSINGVEDWNVDELQN